MMHPLKTIILLTRLLKEDYIKLRGSLYFRLLGSLVDSDAGVRTLGHFCVLNLLLVKDAALFYANFVECIFYFNGVVDHPIYNRFPQNRDAAELFSLNGPSNQSRRAFLYRMMLKNCSDLERLQITQKLHGLADI